MQFYDSILYIIEQTEGQMPKIVGYIGVIGSGKNYQQDRLVKMGYEPVNFKDALVEMCSDIVGYDVSKDYDWFKEHVIGMRRPQGKMLEHRIALDSYGLQEIHDDIMTGRRLLQRVGTEVMRKRDENYWADAWAKKASTFLRQGTSVVANDVRFKNEVEAIRRFSFASFGPIDAQIIFCNYKSDRYDAKSKHPSEKLAQSLLKKGYKDMQEVKVYPVKSPK
jgi:hypothetical protein